MKKELLKSQLPDQRPPVIIIVFVFQISGCQTAPWFTMCAQSPP